MKIIYKNDFKQRLDLFLSKELNLSRSKITSLIKNGKIFVNDKKVKSGYELSNNECIVINVEDKSTEQREIKAINYDLEILYEDKYFIIVNKPNNILVHPSSYNEGETLASYIKAYFLKQGINFGKDDFRWGICHRLDKDTTGLLIVAKSKQYQDVIQEMIMDKKIKREYIGLVKGKLKSKKIKLEVPIIRSNNNKLYMETSTSPDAKEAITYIELIDEYDTFSKVKFRLETGRTHQIRVHCKYLNNPIINDPLYGNEKTFSNFNQLLHAYKISFVSPFDNKMIEVESELPQEFEDYINKNK